MDTAFFFRNFRDFENKNWVLLETSRYDRENNRDLLFVEPITILQIYSIIDLPNLFAEIQGYLDQGYYLAGYFNYECGYYFENIIPVVNFDHPIAWLGVYKRPVILNYLMDVTEIPEYLKQIPLFNELNQRDDLAPEDDNLNNQCFKITEIDFNLLERDYSAKISKIKDYILAGDVYQINFTGRYTFNFEGSELSFYDSLKKKQQVSYGAFIKTDNQTVLSFSPELFFRLNEGKIITKPMKGTVKRGKTIDEDHYWHNWLQNDEKNRAENLMITDLLRNDLGKIAEFGSVKVSEIFAIEKYKTLFQMTSTIEGKLKGNPNYFDIFRALFPCGSITGAPKVRAMEIINELEDQPRGVYTGAVGFFSPLNEAIFNVAIRTITIRGNRGEMGSGGGIVWDSIAEEEFKECKLKASFFNAPTIKFDLLETIKWNGKYFLLSKHINRLAQSATYFNFAFNAEIVHTKLVQNSQSLILGKKYKVRLQLNQQGEVSFKNIIISESSRKGPFLIGLAEIKTDSNDKFFYHKTTNRNLYNDLYRKALEKGYVDVIFRNEGEQITEGAISNVFIKKDGCFFTPPIACGLLNGVYRQYLIEKLPKVIEKELYLNDLLTADAIYISNSVRGLRKVKLSGEI